MARHVETTSGIARQLGVVVLMCVYLDIQDSCPGLSPILSSLSARRTRVQAKLVALQVVDSRFSVFGSRFSVFGPFIPGLIYPYDAIRTRTPEKCLPLSSKSCRPFENALETRRKLRRLGNPRAC